VEKMMSSFKPDSKAPELSWSQEDFRPNPWPSADEAFQKAKSRSEQIVDEAEERARQMEQEAMQKGLEEGRSQGVFEGNQKLEPVVKALEEACEKLQQSRSTVLWESERSLVRLAVSVARCILRRELSTREDVIGKMVGHALKEVDLTDILSLNIHPEDWDILNEQGLVGEDSGISLPRGIQVVRDESVGRGGCVIRSDIGTIDGRLDEQLSAILARFEDEMERNRPSAEEGRE
jgi:flagellar assembly protein FliH